MEESILSTIKRLLGIDQEYMVFDMDIEIHINSCISMLSQLGYPVGITSINGDESKWKDLIGENEDKFNHIREYIYLKVKSFFDPPQISSLIEANERLLKECEYRIFAVSDVTHKEET